MPPVLTPQSQDFPRWYRKAQTSAQAASWPVELALAPTLEPAFYGEIVQFGGVLPWKSGIPVAHTATT
jgi:carbonyl reductase 1